MSRTYKPIRVPLEDYNNLVKKQINMEKVASEIMGKKIKIPFTKIITIMSRNNLVIDDKSLIAYFENWFENGVELIGEDSTSEEEDTTSLYETLSNISSTVFIISDKLDLDMPMMDMEKLNTYLMDKNDFHKHIFLAYYDT